MRNVVEQGIGQLKCHFNILHAHSDFEEQQHNILQEVPPLPAAQ
ncbi:hypothetical protein E2C01_051110 [Portunus trituberculatus]|uniref:Uncharacterized protein n=1 Tax=Portunus trituberculatus TaxID=210409 RepID=A0A5B7GHQ9_PORTR|nr:hypothetical protein [Portunus trituberculatus]